MAAVAAATGLHLGSAPSFSLLRRSDARRRGYTLDGSASLSLSLDADDDFDDGEEQQQKQRSKGGGGAGNNNNDTRGAGGDVDDEDFDDDDEDDDEDSDAPSFSRPPSAPRAGHSRRRTPRSVPSSPGREVRMEDEKEEGEVGGVPPTVPRTTTTTTTAAAAAAASGRSLLAPLSLDPLVEAMSIGEGGEGEGGREDGGRTRRFFSGLDLDRALSSMSIDGVAAAAGNGTENGHHLLLSPGSPARSRSPLPVCAAAAAAAAARGALPPPAAAATRAPRREAPSFAPLNAPSSSRRFGFGLPAPAAPAPAPSSELSLDFDEYQGQQQQQDLSIEALGDTVRQLSMSLSMREAPPLAPPPPPLPPSVATRR